MLTLTDLGSSPHTPPAARPHSFPGLQQFVLPHRCGLLPDLTLSEACEVLGVRPPLDPAVVRAAYLAKLRVTKPDIDPAGFVRLRQAYELATEPAEGPTVLEPSGAAAATLHERVTRALERCPGPLRALERARILEDARDEHPDDALLTERLFFEYLLAGWKGIARDVLDELSRLTADRAWSLRLAHLPEITTAYSLCTPPKGIPLAEQLRAAHVVIELHRRPAEAAALLVDLAKTLTDGELAAHGHDLSACGLEIANLGFAAEGQQVVAALSVRGMKLSGELAEWAALPDVVAPAVRQSLARGLRYGVDACLTEDISARAVRLTAAEQLRSTSPILAARFSANLDLEAAAFRKTSDFNVLDVEFGPTQRTSLRSLWKLGLVVVGVTAMLGWTLRGCPGGP